MNRCFVITWMIILLTSCSTNQQSELILEFTPVQINMNTEIITSEVELIKEQFVLGYRAVLFQINSEEDIYGGVYMDDKLLSIGSVSMNLTPDHHLSISESSAFGKKLIRFSGTPGASYAKSVYLDVDHESVTPLIEIDGSNIVFDLDQDGVYEVISTVGTVPHTSIYKWMNNHIYVSDLNDSIHALAVLYNMENHKFEVYFEENNSHLYAYKDGKLVMYR